MDTPKRRGPGRPRLPTPERRQNMLASKAKWRVENRAYYLQQKRELACRPEYLARRRELYQARQEDPSHGEKQGKSILDYPIYNAPPGAVDAF